MPIFVVNLKQEFWYIRKVDLVCSRASLFCNAIYFTAAGFAVSKPGSGRGTVHCEARGRTDAPSLHG